MTRDTEHPALILTTQNVFKMNFLGKIQELFPSCEYSCVLLYLHLQVSSTKVILALN